MTDFRTIRMPFETEFTEKKSRFIGQISPVSSLKEAEDFLSSVCKKQRGASHHVSAFLLRSPPLERCSDDGEPQGTAGLPILEVLRKQNLQNVVLVVTRYFGGTLLGAGGLIRAYSHAASLVATGAQTVLYTLCFSLSLHLDYSHYGIFMHILDHFPHHVVSSDFLEEVYLTLLLPAALYSSFTEEMREKTAGQIIPQVLSKTYAEIPPKKEV